MNYREAGPEKVFVRGKPTRLTGEERKEFNKKLRVQVRAAALCTIPFLIFALFKFKGSVKTNTLMACGVYLLIVLCYYLLRRKSRCPVMKQ